MASKNPNKNTFRNSARIPPHSINAEESVLGGVLIDNEVLNTAVEILKPEDFYKPSHSEIFKAMISLLDKMEPVDIVTLANQLKKTGGFNSVGGFEELSRLSSVVPSAANVRFYSNIVKDNSLKRKIISEASSIVNDAFDEIEDVSDFVDTVEQRILGISDSKVNSDFGHVGDIVQGSIKLIETLYDRKEPVTGVSTGFKDLDKMTAGLQSSDLIIIAARPSMGKTALALSMAANVATLNEGAAVAVFSLEMSKEQLVLRLLCSEARVDNSRVRTGQISQKDFPTLVQAASRITDSKIFIDDTAALTSIELRAKCRRLNRENKLSLIIVDYLQLMRNPAYSNSREQEISSISRSLKALAKELSVPVIALSQLNRSVESRTDKRPMMSDLRESGAIEQDADVIAFIYRDEVYNKDSTENKGIAELIISKQRNGPIGTVNLAFAAQFTRFDNLAYDDEIPENAHVLKSDHTILDPEDSLF